MIAEKKDIIELPKPTPEELLSLAESLHTGGIARAIEDTIQKQINAAQYYQAYENSDEQGNYFGSEFNIRATAGRIKATYSREPWIFTAATLIAKTMATVPFRILNTVTNEYEPDHVLLKKIEVGNPLEDGFTLKWKGYLDIILGGNFFRAYNAAFSESVHLPVELVNLQLDRQNRLVESVQVFDTTNPALSRVVPAKQVVHFKFPNPFNVYYGLSLFVAASRPLLLDRYKNEFEMAYYLRGATNSGVIETTEDINKTRLERLMRTFESVYTGKRNWWRTIFLPKGAQWKSSGHTMTEMQHLEGLRENRLTILACLGIPPSMVGIVTDVNRSTSEDQNKVFWENTIKPLCDFVASGWNNSYLFKTIYGGKYLLEADYSNIEALQGSLKTKGEQAKAVESYLTINEIRADILGYDPLPDDRGDKFVAEIKPANTATDIFGSLSAEQGTTPSENPIDEVVGLDVTTVKSQVVESQTRIETKLSDEYTKVYEKYLDAVLGYTAEALRKNLDVRTALKAKERDFAKLYIEGSESILVKAMIRGANFAQAQTKSVNHLGAVKKIIKFSELDEEALAALREETEAGERRSLVERAINSFLGFNSTRTEQVLDLIAAGLEDGRTTDQIAAEIRSNYLESYKNQAFTIARTELLSAISQGIKWNHTLMGELFSETKKQWLHVGDVGSNPDARDWHAAFESLGAVASDYKFGGVLDYPRDPAGGASETVNCRCSLVTVIPDDATSNAEVILDRV